MFLQFRCNYSLDVQITVQISSDSDYSLDSNYLSLNEKRCTFYVNYFFIISLCNLSNLSIARINSVKFSIKIQSRNLQFLDKPYPNTRSTKIFALKVIELCSSNKLLYSYIQGFSSVIKSN